MKVVDCLLTSKFHHYALVLWQHYDGQLNVLKYIQELQKKAVFCENFNKSKKLYR